jgi:nicotinamide riboside kinase
MEKKSVIKIVAIGPESTGKTSLCELLAKHFHTEWCPEYAREYLLKHGMNYSYDDLLYIARQQVEMEEKYAKSLARSSELRVSNQPGNPELRTKNSPLATHHSPLLFIDTDMYVMKVWCEFVFGKCHKWILEQIVTRTYDLYLLCNTDLPWIKDELREYPDLESRRKLYFMYKDIMINQSVPWVDISGDDNGRLQKAIDAVDQFLAG